MPAGQACRGAPATCTRSTLASRSGDFLGGAHHKKRHPEVKPDFAGSGVFLGFVCPPRTKATFRAKGRLFAFEQEKHDGLSGLLGRWLL
jgi:hypothetical protein